MSDSLSQKKQFSRHVNRAMRLLALRDHSEMELRRKLICLAEREAFHDENMPAIADEMLDSIVVWCQKQGWQNDERFAERFIKSQARKGFGPQRIRMELAHRKVESHLVDYAFACTEVNWPERARQMAEKKFGLPLSACWEDKAKIWRFLSSKGFLHEDIQKIFRNIAD
ncbi:regulatory protein RecX [Enterobacteriaceae bacterium LUAb1]